MRQETINIYKYEELSEKARERALNNHVDADHDNNFLSEDLNELLLEELKENNIDVKEHLKLYYSLSHCQGDGLCFIGRFKFKGQDIEISHNSHYHHKHSTQSSLITEDYETQGDEEILTEFNELYMLICDKLETIGYEQIEYERSEENFKSLCEANEYEFTENGDMH